MGQTVADNYQFEPLIEDDKVRPFDELTSSGLLWLINRVVFHPRGYALGVVFDEDGEAAGWVLRGDGQEVLRFPEDEQGNFTDAQNTLKWGAKGPHDD